MKKEMIEMTELEWKKPYYCKIDTLNYILSKNILEAYEGCSGLLRPDANIDLRAMPIDDKGTCLVEIKNAKEEKA